MTPGLAVPCQNTTLSHGHGLILNAPLPLPKAGWLFSHSRLNTY